MPSRSDINTPALHKHNVNSRFEVHGTESRIARKAQAQGQMFDRRKVSHEAGQKANQRSTLANRDFGAQVTGVTWDEKLKEKHAH